MTSIQEQVLSGFLKFKLGHYLREQHQHDMDEGNTRVKMDEVDRHLDNTWFTWIGGSQADRTFYYRVQNLR